MAFLKRQEDSWRDNRRVSRKSEIAAAIRYALSRWRALLRYSVGIWSIYIENESGKLLAIVMTGKHVSVTGVYAQHMERGWREIHPVASIMVQ